MTDNDIIKALECCAGERPCNDDCPGNKVGCELEKYVLKLIKSKDAKIERLNKEVDRLSQCVMYHDGQIADALKEFAERLLELFPSDKAFTTISRLTIRKLVNEMEAENNV